MNNTIKTILIICNTLLFYCIMAFDEESFFNFSKGTFYYKLFLSLLFAIIVVFGITKIKKKERNIE